MRIRRTTSCLALLLALALPLACTNPFKPATPEGSTGGGVPEDFSSPESVLATMQRAINSKPLGAQAWLHAFADSTVASDRAYRGWYDGPVKLAWQLATSATAPEPWGVKEELRLPSWIYQLRQNADYDFQWEPDVSQQDGTQVVDTVWFHRKYTLRANSSGVGEIIAQGTCDLSFQEARGRYSIYRWTDRYYPDVTVDVDTQRKRSMSWLRLDSLIR